MKILVIEDEAKTADSVRSGLEAEGYRVDLVRTGDEGSEQLRLRAFDLIILDWMLPCREGLPIEALASIQTLAEARRAEIDAVLDYNIAQHRLLAALGHPATK